jgi:hypothetical protein
MAIESSGAISLGTTAGTGRSISAEFGGNAPHALSEYYDKGNAPSSGEIQMGADFHGTSAGIASGGDVVFVDGSDTVHIFLSSGFFNLTVPGPYPAAVPGGAECLVVGGGGGGGSSGGGGGGGGSVCYAAARALSGAGDYGTTYTVTVGAGGASDSDGGFTSSFSIQAVGGGAGGQGWNEDGSDGANGGGASWTNESGYVGGTGAVPSNYQMYLYWTVTGGNDGYSYNWTSEPPALGGGGGGSSAAATSKNGGNGISYDVIGTSYNWAGGGGGSGYNTTAGSGGTGAAGGGAGYNTTNGSAGSGGYNAGSGGTDTVGGAAGINTGSGGGGGRWDYAGGAGGAGIVVIRYATPA